MREPRNLKQHTASPAKIQMLLERVQLSPEKQHAYAKRLVLCAQGSQFAGVAPVWLRNLLKSTRGPHQSVNMCTLWARGSHRSDTVPDLLHRKQPASQRGDPRETEHHQTSPIHQFTGNHIVGGKNTAEAHIALAVSVLLAPSIDKV